MKRGILVSVLSLVGFAAGPAGAQQMFPLPPAAGQAAQQPLPGTEQYPYPYAQPEATEDPAAYGQQQPPNPYQGNGYDPNAYDPNTYDPNAYDPNAQYAAPDLGPDNEIAQSYDDGYDPQAYTQFQDSLAPYGNWDYDSSYGYVWTPATAAVGTDFEPYASGGHWLRSEYGWTWASDFNWGWAPFHYGRWIPRAGCWSWVPGTMWGPAWVSWRSGNGYVGWAPLPPRGVRLTAWTGNRSPWRFTTAAALASPRPSFLSPRAMPALFARTTVVANDRLLSRGNWAVHVNAGPTRGISAQQVSLSRAAPNALPRLAVYPHAGTPVYSRPWVRGSEAQRGPMTEGNGWRAGSPIVSWQAPFSRGSGSGFGAYGRTGGTPASGFGAGAGATAPGFRPGTTAPGFRPGASTLGAAPVYGRPAPTFGGRPSAGASVPFAPRPGYQQPNMHAYAPATRGYTPPPAGGGFNRYAGTPTSGGFRQYGGAPAASGGFRQYGGGASPAPVGGGGFRQYGGGAPAGGGGFSQGGGGAPSSGGFSHYGGGAPAGGGFSHGGTFGGGAPTHLGGGTPAGTFGGRHR